MIRLRIRGRSHRNESRRARGTAPFFIPKFSGVAMSGWRSLSHRIHVRSQVPSRLAKFVSNQHKSRILRVCRTPRCHSLVPTFLALLRVRQVDLSATRCSQVLTIYGARTRRLTTSEPLRASIILGSSSSATFPPTAKSDHWILVQS